MIRVLGDDYFNFSANYEDWICMLTSLTYLISSHYEWPETRMFHFYDEVDYYADWTRVNVQGLSFGILMML